MEPATTAALIKGGASLLGGVFGGGDSPDHYRATSESITGKMHAARHESKKYGFNPLTVLGNSAQVSGVASGSPLASNSLIQGAISSFADAITGKAAQDAIREKARTKLLQLELERLKAGDAGEIAARAGMIGHRPIRQSDVSFEQPALTAGRDLRVMPGTNAPGLFNVTNDITGPSGVTLPGDGEPWGIDEGATALVFGTPQVAWNQGKMAAEAANESPEKDTWGETISGWFNKIPGVSSEYEPKMKSTQGWF